MNRETLTLTASEVRFATDDDAGSFSGYAAIFDEIVPGYNELVRRGAFTRTLAAHRHNDTRPAMFWWHDPATPIGVWDTVAEDERGLKVTGRLATKSAKGADVYELLKVGAVGGLSIGFNARRQERGPRGVRVLTDVDLVEISLVSLQAAPKARVTSIRQAGRDPGAVAAFTAACKGAANALK